MTSRLTAILCSLCWLVCFRVSAHDHYLLPEKFFLKAGERLVVHQYVGDEFKQEEEKGVQYYITKTFQWITPRRTLDLLRRYADSTLPLASEPIDFDGLGLLAMARGHARVELTGEKFTQYLKEEKLDGILAMRDTMAARPVEREKYTRFLKTLVQSGANRRGNAYEKQLGHTLEILLLKNPYTLRPGEEMTAQVLYRGRPLERGSVEAISKDAAGTVTVQAMKTDKSGKIRFPLRTVGTWMVRITHMIPSTDATADWESFWASYTFAVR